MNGPKLAGAPISAETIHDNMRRHDMTSKEFEEEMRLIEDEPPLESGPSADE